MLSPLKIVCYTVHGGVRQTKLTEHSVVISKSQGLELLRKRGYIFKDEVSADSG